MTQCLAPCTRIVMKPICLDEDTKPLKPRFSDIERLVFETSQHDRGRVTWQKYIHVCPSRSKEERARAKEAVCEKVELRKGSAGQTNSCNPEHHHFQRLERVARVAHVSLPLTINCLPHRHDRHIIARRREVFFHRSERLH